MVHGLRSGLQSVCEQLVALADDETSRQRLLLQRFEATLAEVERLPEEPLAGCPRCHKFDRLDRLQKTIEKAIYLHTERAKRDNLEADTRAKKSMAKLILQVLHVLKRTLSPEQFWRVSSDLEKMGMSFGLPSSRAN